MNKETRQHIERAEEIIFLARKTRPNLIPLVIVFIDREGNGASVSPFDNEVNTHAVRELFGSLANEPPIVTETITHIDNGPDPEDN